MVEALRFESLACLGEGGGRVPCPASHVALVRFNRPLTDDEWRAFAEMCADFPGEPPAPQGCSCASYPHTCHTKVPPMNPRHRDVNP